MVKPVEYWHDRREIRKKVKIEIATDPLTECKSRNISNMVSPQSSPKKVHSPHSSRKAAGFTPVVTSADIMAPQSQIKLKQKLKRADLEYIDSLVNCEHQDSDKESVQVSVDFDIRKN
jgi:hypothetical protein